MASSIQRLVDVIIANAQRNKDAVPNQDIGVVRRQQLRRQNSPPATPTYAEPTTPRPLKPRARQAQKEYARPQKHKTIHSNTPQNNPTVSGAEKFDEPEKYINPFENERAYEAQPSELQQRLAEMEGRPLSPERLKSKQFADTLREQSEVLRRDERASGIPQDAKRNKKQGITSSKFGYDEAKGPVDRKTTQPTTPTFNMGDKRGGMFGSQQGEESLLNYFKGEQDFGADNIVQKFHTQRPDALSKLDHVDPLDITDADVLNTDRPFLDQLIRDETVSREIFSQDNATHKFQRELLETLNEDLPPNATAADKQQLAEARKRAEIMYGKLSAGTAQARSQLDLPLSNRLSDQTTGEQLKFGKDLYPPETYGQQPVRPGNDPNAPTQEVEAFPLDRTAHLPNPTQSARVLDSDFVDMSDSLGIRNNQSEGIDYSTDLSGNIQHQDGDFSLLLEALQKIQQEYGNIADGRGIPLGKAK
jgi:hypothetical protein